MSPETALGAAATPLGALPQPGGGALFRVWAPKRRRVEVVLEGSDSRVAGLAAVGGGYFAGRVEGLRPGALYRYRLDGEGPFPDPASRFQPQGPHGPSELVDPGAYRWRVPRWAGARISGQVIYELHVGTFTREGTWAAAARELPRLAGLGVTAVEMMPVADFPGRRGWGYDGVCWYAPTRLYGRPDDLRAFVDAAHENGLAVLLDVVYNHFGPEGNYLRQFAEDYFSDGRTDWGQAINYDGPGSSEVRRFVAENAAYWIGEYRFDGLRVDATQCIFDRSPEHVLAAVSRAARRAAGARSIVLVAENEPQDVRVVAPLEAGGYGFDAIWNDDFHHSVYVALTGLREAYYLDYGGSPQELVSSVKRGTLYQGQRYRWQRKRRGTPTEGVRPESFVHYLENHDQVANSSFAGARLCETCDPALLRAMTALLLLGRQTPLLFQGQEYGASQPFTFFVDHEPALREPIFQGRRAEMRQFPSTADADARGLVADPSAPETFEACRLRAPQDEPRAARWLALHRDLLALRREDPVFRAQGDARLDGAVLGERLFALRYCARRQERLLLINLGAQAELRVLPEPLLAAPPRLRWRLIWSSEDPVYGGRGTGPAEPGPCWRIAPRCALAFAAQGEDHAD